jgi:serine protease
MPDKYLLRVVVKFVDDLKIIPYNTDQAVEHFFHTGQLGPWLDLKTQFPGITIGRLFTSVPPERIVQLVKETVHRNSTYHPPNFLTFFAITCPSNVNRKELAQVLRDKNKWPKVETAYVQGGPGPSPGVILGPGEGARQGYLGPAPSGPGVVGGIDAKFAWGVTGGDGGGALSHLRFADIEQGWLIPPIYNNHQDLPAGIRLVWGDNGGSAEYEIGHGTAVLGIVLAVPGNSISQPSPNPALKDIVGITPNVEGKFVASSWKSTNSGWNYSVADAIMIAIDPGNPNKLNPGDVLLLEAQTDYTSSIGGWHPVEVEYAEFRAIELATAADVVVIEAAGNHGADLDLVQDDDLKFILKRNQPPNPPDPDFRDSRAIMVGGAKPDTMPNGKLLNFGTRIDCFAWGEQVVTTGFSDPSGTPTSPQTQNCMFDGTSSASAIIAGAALAVQAIKKANLGAPYTPTQMRDILKDPATSTPSANGTAVDRIGVMPDLKRIIGTRMGLAPDVYIRDAVGDNGTTPHTGAIAVSPDIILRLAPGVADPQAAFGQGSGQDNHDSLGVDAQPGKDHVVYVRVRNRGTADAVNVTATVYWSPVATLLTPAMWAHLGSTILPLVPRNGDLIVSPAIPWPASEMPASTGHHCFVGLIGNGADPVPEIPASWPDFESSLRDYNNMALKNFNVVTYDPALSTDIELQFLITGSHDRARPMRLEFQAEAHEDTDFLLQVPFRHRDVVLDMGMTEDDSVSEVSRVRLPPNQPCRSKEQIFTKEMKLNSRLRVRIPNGSSNHRCQFFIRQLYEDREVGRITWRLQPKKV